MLASLRPEPSRPLCISSTSSSPAPPLPPPHQILRMPLDGFRQLMQGGDMLLPSITTGYLAIERLQHEGYL